MVVLGGGAVSYERGTPVIPSLEVLNREQTLAPAVEPFFFFTLITGSRRSLSLKLSDTGVYEPQIRSRLGTAFEPQEATEVHPAVEQIWHIQDSQGQILAVAFRYNILNPSSCPLFVRKRA